MNNSKRLSFLLSLVFLSGTLVFNACSKDPSDNPEPDPTAGEGTASATIEYLDTGEKVQFTGSSWGAMGSGSRDTVVMYFSGEDNPMTMFLMITPAKKGKHTMGENGFESYGMFFQDSTENSFMKIYFLGEDNIDDNDTEMDGSATFDITSLSNKGITGSFEATMIQNSTIVENGEVTSGEIKRVKITNGKFNVPFWFTNLPMSGAAPTSITINDAYHDE